MNAQSKRKRKRHVKILLTLALLTAAFGTIYFLIIKNSDLFITKPVQDSNNAADSNNTIIISGNQDAENYTTVTKSTSELYSGNLILVNNKTSYHFDENRENNLISLFDVKNSAYKVKDKNVLLSEKIIGPLNDMLQAFYDEFHNGSVIVVSGFRTFDYQKQLFNNRADESGIAEAMAYVANPGGSEHHTGLALDFSIFHDDGTSENYTGSGDYSWINENAYQYGFIVRYHEDKKDITGIAYEPWHFRYVGKPHAGIIKENNMCLEEYIDYLRQFEFGKQRLETDGYEIYFVKAGNDSTEIPVPRNHDYTISGNNVDGFIVTVSK